MERFWNDAIGTIVQGALLVGLVMCVPCAVALYFILGPAWMENAGGGLVGAFASTLAWAGSQMAAGFEALMSIVIQQAENLLTSGIGVGSFISSLLNPLVQPIGAVFTATGCSISAPCAGLGAAEFGGQMAGLLQDAGTVVSVLSIAYGVLQVLTLGAGTLVGMLVPFLISLIMPSTGFSNLGFGGPSGTTSSGNQIWPWALTATGTLINATAAVLGVTMSAPTIADFDTGLGQIGNYAGLAAAFISFAAAAGVLGASKALSGNDLLSAGSAAFGILFAIGSFLLTYYILTTSNPALKKGTPGAGALDLVSTAGGVLGFVTQYSAIKRDAVKPNNRLSFFAEAIAIGLTAAATETSATLLITNGM